MFHSNRNDVIEAGDDIADILGVHVAEENGSKVATLKVILDPRKDFQAVKDFFIHLTNGINHRLLGPFTAVDAPADLPTAPVPAAVEPTEATTEPLVETPASTEPPVTGPSDATTSVDTAEETTVEVPISEVATGNKKGN